MLELFTTGKSQILMALQAMTGTCLKYDSLTYTEGDTININIFSLGTDGNGGASAGDLWSEL